MVKNASYFAFTATPKNKTLEMFGKKERLPDGTTKPEPHYVYTMKQAIEEGFIMDVLRHFTPVQSYYKLAKTIEDDPKFDKKRAQRLLRYYVESNQYAIHEKANIYNQYQTAKEEAQRLGTIRHNLEQTLGRKIEHKKEQER